MRLLITTDAVGGVWRFALELVQGLLQAGDSVALVSFGRAASPAQHKECEALVDRWGERFRYRCTDIPLEWMQANSHCFEEGISILGRVAAESGSELLHTSQYCYGAAELDIPTVVTAHSDVLSWAQACRTAALEETEWLRRYCSLVQKGLEAADAVAAPTGWMLRALSDNFSLPANSAVIANGCTIRASSVPRVLRAVTAGRLWDEAKDIGLLQAVTSPMPLLVAGESECDGVNFRAPHGLRLIGHLCEEEMLRLLAASAVYICTSRYEPFGLAPLEAALSGCAVVVRDIPSLREVWSDAALYFGDAVELSDVLLRLAKEPEMLREAQQRALLRAQLYTRRRMTDEYRVLYRKVLQAREQAHVA